jgi:hypothetical protein
MRIIQKSKDKASLARISLPRGQRDFVDGELVIREGCGFCLYVVENIPPTEASLGHARCLCPQFALQPGQPHTIEVAPVVETGRLDKGLILGVFLHSARTPVK